MENSFTLLSVPDFLGDLTDKIQKASKQIYIQAMIVELGDLKSLTSALLQALNHHVEVNIVIDFHTLLITEGHIMHFPLTDPVKELLIKRTRKSNYEVLKTLHEKGAHIYFINKPELPLVKFFPKLKRNHIKLCLVDGHAYMGGTNIYATALKYADFMIRFDTPIYTDVLQEISKHMSKNIYESDKRIKVEDGFESEFLIDIGKPNSSIIYDEAIKIVENAKNSILFISQYLPDFELLKVMNKKSREGVKIKIITQPPKLSGAKIENFIDRLLFLSRSRIKGYIYPKAKTHTKVIITDIEENPTLIFGSHNYSKFGVIFATNEIAFKTKHPELIKMVYNWTKSIENECIPLYLYKKG